MISIVIMLFVGGVALVLYAIKFHGELSVNNTDWGVFGDYIGGTLNPLISGSAIYWIIKTYNLQKKELFESRTILQGQSEALKKQNIESSFFQLMSLFNDLINGLSISGRPLEHPDDKVTPWNFEGTEVNKQCFEKLHKILINGYFKEHKRGDYKIELTSGQIVYKFYNTRGDKIGEGLLSLTIEKLNNDYYYFYQEFGHLIGHYFRTLFHIIKFIDNSLFDDEQKKQYISLVRAQLSKYELGLLFYNSINPRYGLCKFFPLIHKYELLKHLEDEVLINPQDRDLWIALSKTIQVNP